jgi:hypothetical protein
MEKSRVLLGALLGTDQDRPRSRGQSGSPPQRVIAFDLE